jgi:hypothetical protein
MHSNGSSSGFVLEYALSQEDIVVATLRRPEVLSDLVVARYPTDKLVMLKADVSKDGGIDMVFYCTSFRDAQYALKFSGETDSQAMSSIV